MALTLTGVSDPQALADLILEQIKKPNDDKKSFKTWEARVVKEDGNLVPIIRHIGEGQWANKVSFKFKANKEGKTLRFFTHEYEDDAFAYVHGRLLEQLAAHFGDHFKSVIYEDARSKK